ncbi:MAG: asparagine synthase (glutamine-hydrolyzing) [Verrucomicrobiaceae bacterium]|nr:asparagine synthase (glutamine-hydrolyzing) [Verrucomicrobiaceae bacterium]
MCGFLGWFKALKQPWQKAERAHQSAVLDGLTHRGPDDAAELDGNGWWLGFRRLAIQDLSERGRQPMRFGDGRWTLVFNGEIYNHRELRQSLGDYPFRSSGDAEVLGALLMRQPITQVLPQLRGMFAFAWWDQQEHVLLAARDGFGIKPLYYSDDRSGDLWIGSEVRSVHALVGKKSSINGNALAQFLRWGAVQAPETIYDQVQSLLPGHLMRWSIAGCKVEPWFSPEWPTEASTGMSWEEQRSLVRDTLIDSVRAHLVSDVPVGVFLSGGLDSTLLVACMKHLGQSNVQAFSIGYDEGAGVPDETSAAEMTAKEFGCQFIKHRLDSQQVEMEFDSFISSLDQPSSDALNTYLVAKLAAQHVKVVLSGLGADEWFGGYNYHRLALIGARSPLIGSPLGDVLAPLARRLHQSAGLAWRNNPVLLALCMATGAAGQTGLDCQQYRRSILDPQSVAELLRRTSSEVDLVTRNDLGLLSRSWMQEIMLAETRTYLPNMLLRDNDSTSMAHSLELRVPMVDKEVFALAGRLPSSSKVSTRSGKLILRAAFEEMLPSWMKGKSNPKLTFTLPLMKWLLRPCWRERLHDTLLSSDALLLEWIDRKIIKSHLSEYETTANTTKAGWSLCQPVWMLLVLESWLQKQRSS